MSNPPILPCGRPDSRALPAVTQSQSQQWQDRLRDYLTDQGLKYTEQRWKIASLILATHGHLDAPGLVEKVKKKHPEIGAATVYRNIKVLCDAEILKESLTGPNGQVIYELFDEEHHDHIVCLDCGEIFEFHDEKIEQLQNAVTQRMKFTPVRHRHVLYSHCEFFNRTDAKSKARAGSSSAPGARKP